MKNNIELHQLLADHILECMRELKAYDENEYGKLVALINADRAKE